MYKVGETKLETCQGGPTKSNGNLSWAQVKGGHEEVAMDKFSHYVSMASICSGRALEDKERRSEWLGWAEVWNELADDAIGHPFEEKIANRSSDLAEFNYEKVE
jgi:hypothetical protein